MRRTLRLAVIHRHRLVRTSLVSAISQVRYLKAIEVDHSASNRFELLAKAQLDAVLIDQNLRDGLAVELTQEIRHRLEGVKVLLLVPADGDHEVIEGVEAGAHGCLCNDSTLEELATAVETVFRGETYCSPQIVDLMMRQLAQLAREARSFERVDSTKLTEREFEILQLMAHGSSNKQIARELSLSLYTVKNHVHNILEKLEVSDRREAVAHAHRQQWLPTSRRT